MDKFTKDQKKRELKVKMIGMLAAKVEELDDVFGDMLDDLAAELGLGPVENEEESDRRYNEYCWLQEEVTDAAIRQFGEELMGGTIWALLSLGKSGMELEFFSERPHTADGDPGNWPSWFRVYEGSINGGDSIVTDGLGKAFG